MLYLVDLMPLTLLVTMDVIRYTQGKMIEWDATMMSVSRGVGAKFHRSALTEELGQVSYIMSDKTGTLT